MIIHAGTAMPVIKLEVIRLATLYNGQQWLVLNPFRQNKQQVIRYRTL